MAKQQSSMGFFLLLMISLLIIFDPRLRASLGAAVGAVFYPLFGFGYKYPVLTVFIAGSIVIVISAIVRHVAVDWVEMAKVQEMVSAFQKKYREALKSQNKYMIKKMQKMQAEIMAKQSKVSSEQMKLMPITLIIFVPIFTWIWEFLMNTPHYYFDVPWSFHVSFFKSSFIFPNWILLYMLLSIPLTQVVQYVLRLKWQRRR
ncbi:MAG: DUF106 domain-containing protein [Thermoplasmata archaeon]|nr:MAG: DUF106 domain-containing protein [Thermoplasmata archaeon]